LEFSFLLDRVRQLKRLGHGLNFVSDYYVEKCLWFASLNLSDADFQKYKDFYPAVASVTPAPSLVVFLHLPLDLIRENIRSRGREYEKEISASYLLSLNEKYRIESAKVSKKLPVLNINLTSNISASYSKVVERVVEFLQNFPHSEPTLTEISIDWFNFRVYVWKSAKNQAIPFF